MIRSIRVSLAPMLRSLAAFAFAGLGTVACSGSDTVQPPPDITPPHMNVSIARPVLEVGETTLAKAAFTDANGNSLPDRNVTWSVLGSATISMDEATGLVRALDAGTATVVAKSGAITATASVTVLGVPVVNTGPGDSDRNAPAVAVYNNGEGTFNYLAGKFTLAEPTSLVSAQAWMDAAYMPEGTSMTMGVNVRQDDRGVPGDAIYSRDFQIDAVHFDARTTSVRWVAFDPVTVTLQPGTYWLSFEPAASTGRPKILSFPGGAQSPITAFMRYWLDSGWTWTGSPPRPIIGLGFRIYRSVGVR